MPTATADLLDERGPSLQSCLTQLRTFSSRSIFEGRIRTIRCRDDTVLVKDLLAQDGTGMVLVIDGGGDLWSALMGDRTASMAASNGWFGIVINGAVRDVDALSHLDIGLKALGSSPRKPGQQGVGDIDVPVTFGGATFWPGAMLWSDADGIVTEFGPPSGTGNTGGTT